MLMQDIILKKINDYFQKISINEHETFIGHNSFPYIATEIDFVVNCLNIIKKREAEFVDKRFLDVGSGIGNICEIAHTMGLDAHGIELNPVLFQIAKQIYSEISFYNIDINDFNNYVEYDIVFYFHPFGNEEMQEQLQKKIENNISVGSYVITRVEEKKDKRFISINIDDINDKIWLKLTK